MPQVEQQIGKYQLVRKLATGGMAEVFLAKAAGPMGFEKYLVVKRILPQLASDPSFLGMFRTEAQLAARLSHANIVQIFDFGQEGNSYFIAMEYVDGADLRTLSRRAFQAGGPIPYPLSARMICMACEGLAHAHELLDPQSGRPLGLVHRDVSADNLLVSSVGVVKLVDFGIAKAANLAGQQTKVGVIKGKLSHLAPEYLLGNPVDARIDIYALGVVLFELITGRRPFESDNDAALLQAVLRRPAPDVRSLRADAPAELAQIVERALAKAPERRYQSCRELQADLERYLLHCGEVVGARQIADLVKRLAPPGSTGGAEAREPTPPSGNKLEVDGTRVERRRPEARPAPAPTAPLVPQENPESTRVERRRPEARPAPAPTAPLVPQEDSQDTRVERRRPAPLPLPPEPDLEEMTKPAPDSPARPETVEIATVQLPSRPSPRVPALKDLPAMGRAPADEVTALAGDTPWPPGLASLPPAPAEETTALDVKYQVDTLSEEEPPPPRRLPWGLIAAGLVAMAVAAVAAVTLLGGR